MSLINLIGWLTAEIRNGSRRVTGTIGKILVQIVVDLLASSSTRGGNKEVKK